MALRRNNFTPVRAGCRPEFTTSGRRVEDAFNEAINILLAVLRLGLRSLGQNVPLNENIIMTLLSVSPLHKKNAGIIFCRNCHELRNGKKFLAGSV
jgi:hypothetical protein